MACPSGISYWYHASDLDVAPAGASATPVAKQASPERPQLGSLVVLRKGSEGQGCLTAGRDVGTVIEDDGSSMPFKVRGFALPADDIPASPNTPTAYDSHAIAHDPTIWLTPSSPAAAAANVGRFGARRAVHAGFTQTTSTSHLQALVPQALVPR